MENLIFFPQAFPLIPGQAGMPVLLFSVANHVRKHPITTRHPGTQLPVPHHARIDVVSLAVFCDQQSAS
jgi:hypothetical protein